LLATANFTATPTFGKVPLKVRLTNESTNTTNYQWYVNGELQATTRNWETVLNPSGSYELMLVTYNKHPQCADTLMRTVHAFDSAQIVIPNVFTPNNDGLNDQFSVTTFGVKKLHYQIYNRYEKLFTEGELATSLEQGKYTLWLGTNPDTITPAKPDVYFYIITTYDWADRKKHHTGYVHLKR
jgi:gliding motility-associated-like protein